MFTTFIFKKNLKNGKNIKKKCKIKKKLIRWKVFLHKGEILMEMTIKFKIYKQNKIKTNLIPPQNNGFKMKQPMLFK